MTVTMRPRRLISPRTSFGPSGTLAITSGVRMSCTLVTGDSEHLAGHREGHEGGGVFVLFVAAVTVGFVMICAKHVAPGSREIAKVKRCRRRGRPGLVPRGLAGDALRVYRSDLPLFPGVPAVRPP